MSKTPSNSKTVCILVLEEIGGGENATQKALNFKISAQACFVYSLEKQGVSAVFLNVFFSVWFSQCWTLLVLDNGGCTKISFFSVSFGFSLIHSQILGGSIQFFFNRLYARKSKIYSWHIGLDTTDSLVCIYVCFFCILLWKNNVHIMTKNCIFD